MDMVLGHMKQLVWPPEAVFSLHEAKKLTFDILLSHHVLLLKFCPLKACPLAQFGRGQAVFI